MSPPTHHKYDAEAVLAALPELCAHYCGPHRNAGRRLAFRCPACGKRKFEVLVEGELRHAGCFNAGCAVPESTDAVGVVAHFEGLDYRTEFVEVLRRAYDALGWEPLTPGGRNGRGPAPAPNATSPAAQQGPAASSSPWVVAEGREGFRPAPEPAAQARPDPLLVHHVYAALMELCPLVEPHAEFLRSRGLTDQTIARGRFGSISKKRVRHVEGELARRFGEDLLTVPGFYRPERGRGAGQLLFSLREEYVVIPYHDADGRLTAVEGRAISAKALAQSKYRTPTNGGNHLYVFPDFVPDELVAFCEGPIGAVVAAQHGIPVGSIQGVKRYRTAGQDAPLPELAGVDFGGRGIPYIPDLDVKPEARADVEAHLPGACEYLISRCGGRPLVARLPSGKDLDEYLLSVPPDRRRPAFDELLASAEPPSPNGRQRSYRPPQRGFPRPAVTGQRTAEDVPEPASAPAQGDTPAPARARRDDGCLNTSQHDAGAEEEALEARDEPAERGAASPEVSAHEAGEEGTSRSGSWHEAGEAGEGRRHGARGDEELLAEPASWELPGSGASAEPEAWWGFPRRPAALDYAPAAPARWWTPREVLRVISSSVVALLGATVVPRALLDPPAPTDPAAPRPSLRLAGQGSESAPSEAPATAQDALAAALEAVAALTHAASFPPAVALLAAALAALAVGRRRRALRDIREGRR